ncbi:MAG: S9 family peptidase, partial [Pirellula sp.]
MKKKITYSALLLFTLLGSPWAVSQDASTTSTTDDPHVWLEDVSGEKALDWVKARNEKAKQRIESDPSFEKLRNDLLEILDSNARIPFVAKNGEFYYNFWRDKKNERGLWRRTTLSEYKKAEPNWEVLLDLDALGKTEGENWVWKGASLLRPDYTRALVTLSRGGADADVTREFDLVKKEFVADGFQRPESKGGMSWIDLDHVFVSTDFGAGTMTDSGYPRIAKIWTRGTPMEQAVAVYEGTATDMSIGAAHDDSPGFERDFVTRNIAFYNDELYWLKDRKDLVKIDVPNTANKSVFHQYLLVELREPWTVGDNKYAAGSLLVTKFDDFMAGKRSFEVLFAPTDTTALSSFGFTKDAMFINVLEDVKNRIYVLKSTEKGWSKEPLRGAPRFGTVNVTAVDSDESNDFFMTSTDYLNPTTLSMGTIGSDPVELKRLPNFFDPKGLEISQHFATSADGTRVPYFMVSKADLKPTGDHPTLLYGYGGFEISLQPNYSASVGRAWLTQGGVYVVANIRG